VALAGRHFSGEALRQSGEGQVSADGGAWCRTPGRAVAVTGHRDEPGGRGGRGAGRRQPGLPSACAGPVFADLAAAIADGAGAVTGIEVLGDRESLLQCEA